VGIKLNNMSANNELLIQKIGNKYSVSDIDIEVGEGFFISDNHFDTLEEAIKAAQKYQQENEVEYGLNFNMKFPIIKPGWHYLFCKTCGKKYAKVTHYGGKKKKKTCKACSVKQDCMECYIKKIK